MWRRIFFILGGICWIMMRMSLGSPRWGQPPPAEVEKSLRLGDAGVAWGYVLSAVWSERKTRGRKQRHGENCTGNTSGKTMDKWWQMLVLPAEMVTWPYLVCQQNIEFTDDGGMEVGSSQGLDWCLVPQQLPAESGKMWETYRKNQGTWWVIFME